jgi:hypothetical protein
MFATKDWQRTVCFPWHVIHEADRTVPLRLFALVLFFQVFAVTPGNAAPVLIAEFWHRNVMAVKTPSPPPLAVPFSFGADNSSTGQSFLFWQDNYGPSNTGMTFLAPQDVVDDANVSIVLPTARFAFSTGPANISDPLRLTNPSCGDSCVQVLVPDITRYTVTSVERINEQLEFIDQPQFGTYILKGGQRIRYLGELIPEPSAIVLFLLALCAGTAITPRRMRNYG